MYRYRITKKKCPMIPLNRNPIFHNGGLSCECTKNFPETMKDEMFWMRFYMLAVHYFVSDDCLGKKKYEKQVYIKFETSLVKSCH